MWYMAVIVLGSSIWVLVDAKNIGVRKGLVPGFFNLGAWGWFFCCLLLWIVGFPAYMAMRSRYKEARKSPTGESPTGSNQPR